MTNRHALTYRQIPLDRGSERKLNQVFGANVRRAREQQGISQTLLSSISGVRRQLIVDIEHGATDVRLSNVKRLADALCIDPADLLGEQSHQNHDRLGML